MSYYSTAKRISNEVSNAWYADQYNNLSNTVAHYEKTGPEIWKQTDGKVTHFVVGVGTGGTISGVAKFLKEKNKIKIWGIDTYGSVLKSFMKRVFLIKMRYIHIQPRVLVKILFQRMLISH